MYYFNVYQYFSVIVVYGSYVLREELVITRLTVNLISTKLDNYLTVIVFFDKVSTYRNQQSRHHTHGFGGTDSIIFQGKTRNTSVHQFI